jgi:RNA polymerase sigma-70 factor (sigma-E family)
MLRLATVLVDDVPSAEDVVQEAFASLYSRLGRLRDQGAAAAYLRTSVVNGARSALRRRRTARTHLNQTLPERGDHDAAPGPDHRMLWSVEQQAVRKALAALPARQREVLTLRFIGDLSDQEIVATTGLSHGNVRSAASRGLSALRTSIGGRS